MDKFFLLTFFQNNGFCYFNKRPICGMYHPSKEFLEKVVTEYNLKVPMLFDPKYKNFKITLRGNSVIDFLHNLYGDESLVTCFDKRKYNFYKRLSNSGSFKFIKAHPFAEPPSKTRISDSGYDLTLVSKLKTDSTVEYYDTGIIVEPPFGYYFDLVPRSSIAKSGYVLANSVGIIDRTYQGTIIVPLIKLDITKPDLVLPCKLVQIIPRKIEHFVPIEIQRNRLESSERGEGGFGSTGN